MVEQTAFEIPRARLRGARQIGGKKVMTEFTDAEEPVTAAPLSGFRVTRSQDAEKVVLDVAGDVDTVTAPELVRAAEAALADAPPVLVVDLTAVEFLASPGLTALLTIHQESPPGTSVRIVAAGRATLRPIQLTGLEDGLPLYPTREAALTGA